MKKLSIFFFALFLLASCSTVGVSIMELDQVFPARLTLPAQLKKVGLIDRVNSKETAQKENAFAVPSSAVVESLAKRIAESEYFDDVIVCDSDVSMWGRRGNVLYALQQDQVKELCEDLGVDMILSLENLYAQEAKLVFPLGVAVGSQARIYTPNKAKPLTMLLVNDTISWDLDVEGNLPLSIAREDITDYIATSLARQITPNWQTVSRYYFDGGNVAMRDGGMYARKGQWEEALNVWTDAASQAKGRLKEQFSFNIALAQEMTGHIDLALETCKEQSVRVEVSFPDLFALVTIYRSTLEKRMDEVNRLNLQMTRIR